MKTLGIKFEVAGVKEAQAGLNSLRSGLNSALNQNKKAVEDYQRDLNRGWQEWKTENFGTTAQKQNLTIRQDQREFRERSTYKNLSVDNRALVLEFRLAYKDFFTTLEKLLEEKQNPNIFEKMLGFIGKPIGFAVDAILFPFQSAIAGMFERMGEVQVEDFAAGFKVNLQRSLGLSFEETGGDVGKIIGTSLYKVYQKSINTVDDFVKGKLQFNLADTLIDAFTYTVKTLAKELPALALRTHRRIQINKNAIPEARRAAGLKIIENDLPEATRKDIENNKSITLVYGGANTDRADIGKDYTARVMKPYLKGSAVIPMTRQWTNSAVDSEFQGDIRNLIKLILSNQTTAQTFKSFISESGLDSLGGVEQAELIQGLDLGGGEIDLSSIERIAEIVESLMENKDFALGKALQATFKGYNPDDVLGAAEAIALMEQFPDKLLQIIGFSHGGYNALGTVDLLNRMGYDKVIGASIGTPITGANATVNPDNFRAFMGDRDYYYKALTGLAGDNIDFPEFFELGENEGTLHSLQGYVRGDNLRGGLQAFLGDRVALPSEKNYGKHDSAYGYAVGELGAETALIRTLMTYLGESKLGAIDAKEGFVFSAEETLPGYTNNIKKLGQNLKDEDTKKFHAEYIDFLETLQQELQIAEQLAAIGKQYKPVESLKKAAKIFPQMENLAKKHDNSFDSSKQSIFEFENQRDSQEVALEAAKQEAAEKDKFVFFQRKVKQQKDNIERTFQAMLGRNFTKKDESKGIYSFYNPEDYEQRAGNFEGMVNWLENDVLNGASEAEKADAKPILDLLKNITNNIRSVGSTGELDLETIRQAENLLNIDLKEFDLLFREFERNDKSSIDVNQYKDELRTFRRNRDQLLNERIIPDKIDQSLDSARAKINNSPGREVESNEQAQVDNQQIIENYNNQLNQIIERSKGAALEAINNNDLDFDVETSYSTVKDMVKVYRNAVTNGLFEQARETGELLLEASEYLKQIFNQSGDSRKGQLSRIQSEVISGDRGAGRSSIPLAEIFQQTDAVQLQLDLWDDTADGARQNLNRETGQQIGTEFAEGIIEGATDELDINSPSRVFEWIGGMVKAGFNKGVSGIADYLGESIQPGIRGVADSVSNFAQELDGSRGLLDPLFETEGADESVNDFFGNLINKISDTFDDLKSKYPILGRVIDFIGSIGGELLQVLGIFSLGESLISFGTTALDTAMKMESLERSIVSVSNSAADGAKNISFVRNEAKRLSIDLTTAAEAYKRIVGATKNTPLEGLQTEQLFTTLATTARNRGLNTDATNRLFLGFEQVIAKNEFKSEEVRGQLSEVMGDIQPLLASAVGVPVSNLNDLMESGALKAPEVMPKLMALLDAQNAALGDGAQTAQASQTRLNNAILEFQDAVGKQLQPVQKMGLDSLASALSLLQKYSQVLIKLVSSLVTTMLVNLTLKLLATKLAVNGVLVGLERLIGLLTSAPFLAFAGKFLLISAAIEVWTNNIKLASNAFPDLQKDIQDSARSLDALRRAFDETGEAAKNYGDSQPKQMQLNEGWELPEWLQGIGGGERLNWDNLFRNRVNRLGEQYRKYQQSVYDKTDQNITAPKFGITTQAQKKQADFIAGSGDLISTTDQTLSYGQKARSVLEETAAIDAKARDLQSQTRNILSGDSEALNEALKAEQAVLAERDQLLQKSASYSEALQGDIQRIKNRFTELDELDKTGGTEEEIAQRKNSRKSLEERLEALLAEKKAIDEINARIPKFLSQVNALLRNSSERVKGYIGSQEDNAVVNRNQAIEEALANGLSDAELELKLDNLSTSDLKDRISFVNQEIKSLEDKLSNAYLKEGVSGLERAAKLEAEKDGKAYLGLTPEVLTRMAGEGRSSAETEAANILLALDEYQGILAQSQSGLLDSIKTNQDKLKDFNKTISDYFYRLTEQIKEANLETQKLISNLFYTDLKNKLLGAIAPGSNTFVSGIIDNVQNIIDQAGQVAQKIFGDKAAELGFESETRTLATEMQDFLRQVKGASDALDEFASKLKGTDTSSNSNSGSAATDDLTALRRAIIGKESGTNFKAVNPHSGALGYGQVMPANVESWTKEALGRTLTPEQFLNDSLAQVEVINFKLNQYLQKELKEGYDLDTAVRRVASTWYSGQPGNYNKTKARFYNGHEYPSDDSYTKDILSKFKTERGGNLSSVSSLSKEGNTVAQKALNWEGKNFKEGVKAMCAGFVRQVLKESGVDLGVTNSPYDAGKQPNNGELMARSFFGSDIGTVFKDKKQAQAGDLVGFFDTYQYGQKPGAITHVGIYTGNNQMVDRSTSSAPVRHRSIDSYGQGNYIFMRPHAYIPEGDISPVAQTKNQELVTAKAKNLELTKQETEQLRQSLETEAKNKISLNQRQGKQGRQESDAAVLGVEDKIFGIKNQYSYQSATTELTNNLRSLKQQFIDADLDIASKITNTEDAILSITNSIPVLTEQIAKFKAIGTPEAMAAASVQQSALDELNKTLPTMQANLEKLKVSQGGLNALEEQSNYWQREQGNLKIEQERLTKENIILEQKANLAAARGTVEERRQLKLKQEEQRLELAINKIREENSEGQHRNELILGEQRQSKVNKENIDYDSQLEELDIEKKLLDYQTSIDDKKAGFMSRFGLNFGAEKIKKQNAIIQENARFKKELQEAQKLYAGQPALLEKFTRAARELNAVNLQGIEKEFKTLGNTVEDYFSSATQGFFTQFTTNFFDGKAQSDRAQLEERLRYAEEVVGLENQYREEPGKLAHLKNRARELNEQKLSGITQEFNLFGRAVELGKQALLEFVKQLAQMAAQQAASKAISSILGVVLGGVSSGGGKNFDGVKLNKAPKAFKADKGITVGKVENFNDGGSIQERKISDRLTEIIKGNAPGVQKAWQSEGEGAQLGVFHVGEELLSRKTGEAGRYQGLKAKYGINPLAKIGVFASGGTIGDVGTNVLSSIGSTRPRIDLSGLKDGNRGQKAQASKNVTINTTVVTPNADSFRLNQDQMNQDLMERLRRGI